MNAQIPRVLCAAFDEIKIITIFNYINWAHGQVYIAIFLLYTAAAAAAAISDQFDWTQVSSSCS